MNTEELEEWLSRPSAGAVEALERTSGDLLVLGAGGKMGPTLSRMARRALPSDRRVYAVSRFSDEHARRELERFGVETISCDLLDRRAVERLPDASNVISMAGQKFGTSDSPGLTWMINGVLSSIIADRYAQSRIVVFSTGCVYSLTTPESGGSGELDSLNPPGEYAWSCVARERLFAHYSRMYNTRMLIFRLNYAIDLRYGVLHDIAVKVWHNQPVDVTTGFVNVIWQGDANSRALQSLSLADFPAVTLNVTGRDCLSVRWLAEEFGRIMNRTPRIVGTEGTHAWLSSSAQSFELFGEVTVSLDEMMKATADWIQRGGKSLGKPTHFESSDGRF